MGKKSNGGGDEYKYLGFTISNKERYREHIKELRRKGMQTVRKIWGLGERMCRNDFKRRWMLFKYLIQNVMKYGVEIWGWEKMEELEKIMINYIRWIFNVDFCTPRYLIMRELRMNKLRIGWDMRARRYEEKVET